MSNGPRLHYAEHGDPRGETILLLYREVPERVAANVDDFTRET